MFFLRNLCHFVSRLWWIWEQAAETACWDLTDLLKMRGWRNWRENGHIFIYDLCLLFILLLFFCVLGMFNLFYIFCKIRKLYTMTKCRPFPKIYSKTYYIIFTVCSTNSCCLTLSCFCVELHNKQILAIWYVYNLKWIHLIHFSWKLLRLLCIKKDIKGTVAQD